MNVIRPLMFGGTPKTKSLQGKSNQEQTAKKPVVLLVMDGWGLRDDRNANAVKQANPKNVTQLMADHPNVQLKASGRAVGLPHGKMGNSEVGHLTLGAGRIVPMSLPRINRAIRDGSFFKNPVFLKAIDHVRRTGGTLHLMGLVSDGGVHSHLRHLNALLDMAKQNNVKNLRVHAFLDGRDTAPKSARKYLKQVEEKLKDYGYPQIATVSGRYYAMDRDKRWDRVEKAYHAMMIGQGQQFDSSLEAVKDSYQSGKKDEFVVPAITDPNYKGIDPGDAVLMFNFRADRMRQLARAMTDNNFTEFFRKKRLVYTYTGSMTGYDKDLDIETAYPKLRLRNTLGEILANHGKKQLRTAETEKYAHVTYFFNGGAENPFKGEDRTLIPSPKVATYDLQPEMNVKQVADRVIEAIRKGDQDVIVANFANPDMVGHTGVMKAAVKAVQAVDKAVGRVAKALLKADGVMLLTADHGNAEQMEDDAGRPHTAHTTNPVPLVLVSNREDITLKKRKRAFGLSNIAPTILSLLGIAKPPEMNRESLIKRVHQ